ncbi:putative metallo-hydrolase [Winogradskya humida]|uniref:Metallo-hydrolase n=2 Tax=Winogradskya humida TaxID=113566 RepID=A0ABQ3ZKZ4_9ACTN|nr:putative metallo-hydrolase [Actinoplanes humidus]
MLMPTAPMVAHVLLLETAQGLVLVDTGFGLQDIADPGRRLGPVRTLIRPVLRPEETAAHQVERLGFRREDVRHILITHFDLDHIGGIADFPHASIHVTATEALGARTTPTRMEKNRYRPLQWAHGPKLVEHTPAGEPWQGFAAAQPLTGIDEGIVLIALPGHTRGHMAVAVDAGNRWILHAGDAFYHRGTIDGTTRAPLALRIQERLVAHDITKVRANHARLAELHRSGLAVISAHDPVLFAAFAS